MVKIKFARFTERAKMPTKNKSTDVGYDIYAIQTEHTDENRTQIKVYTGIGVQPEKGYYVEVLPRSSIYKKHLQLANSCAIIDPDYTGEIILIFNKIPTESVSAYGGSLAYSNACFIKPGEKIAQIIVRKCIDAKWEEVNKLDKTERGSNGFGSSGE